MLEFESPLLSLCIATNGISEWIFPVLDSIYSQNVDTNLFEVVVTDNGTNECFFNKMNDYKSNHSNLVYRRNNAFLFENQIEALRASCGEFLKFVNHRALMEPGAINWMLELVKANLESKPVMYLSNGALNLKEEWSGDFNGFVKILKRYASWTTGGGVWRTDFEKIPKEHVYNKISPHSDVLFAERKKELYIVDDKRWSKDIDVNHSKKGNYDLYKAFGVEEFSITLGLYIDGDISVDTLKVVKKDYENFLSELYLYFNILKHSCSYDLTGFNDAMGIFFNGYYIKLKAYFSLLRKLGGKIKKIFTKKSSI